MTDLPVSAAATRPVESLPAQTIPTPALTLPTLPQPVLPVPPVGTLPVQATGPLSPEAWPGAAAPAPGQPFTVAVPPDWVPAVAVAPDAFAADSPGAPVPARAASGPGEFALPAPVVPSWFPASPAPVLRALGEASWPGETSLEGVLEGPAGSGFQPAGTAPPAGLTVPVTVPVPLPVSVLPVSAPLPESVPGLPDVGRSPVLPVIASTLPLPGAVPLPETVSVPVPPVGGSPALWDDMVRAALPSLFGAGPQIRAAVPGLVPVVLPVVGAAAPQAVLPGAQTSPPPGSRPGAELPVVPGVQAVTPLGVPLAGAPQGPGLNGPQSQVLRALQAAVRQDGHGQPLAPGAQASLARLMGTSVADVRVIRNAGVPAALQAAQADALTVGRTVFLSPDTPLDSGAGRALAAHEFTHALRQKTAGFVPDVLRRAPGRPDSSAEEAVALATEHASVHGPDSAGQPTPTRRLPGLPAPWEPLPWETGSFGAGHGDRPDPSTWGEARPAREAQLPLPAADRPALPAGLGLQSAGLAGPGGLGNVVNAAATDRAKPQEARDTQAGAPPVGRRAQGTPSVDLDQVAREVYARLRERLSSELRRH
ncbi:DUF4157 domain-containing protein [Deinococcus sp. A31D244]|uniref:eCIS core domain-containing protein n=1 Tax=Deinococcus sp. A31D244 TaxID=3397675 RepID=UPI0039DF499E